MKNALKTNEVIIEKNNLQQILDALSGKGYQTIGPLIRNNAIIYDALTSIPELPVGWHDQQGPGDVFLHIPGHCRR